MKRQNWRKLTVILALLLFPITIYYFSPYLILYGASEGVVTGSFIVFGVLFVLSLFGGRLFCGYLCPTSGLQECLNLVQVKKAKGGWLHSIRYIIWVIWLVAIGSMFAFAGGIKEIDFFYQTTNGISIAKPIAYTVYYVVIMGVLILQMLLGKRAFCHYVCWISPFMVVGARLGKWLKIPAIHMATQKEKCIGCRRCTEVCPMSLDVEKMAKVGKMGNSECILCGECIDCCPKKVIKYKVGRGDEL